VTSCWRGAWRRWTWCSLDGDEDLGHDELTAWMTTLNSLRLALGTRLDVDEELPQLDPDDPLAPDYAVYEYLGWLLAQIVEVLSSDLHAGPGGPAGSTAPTDPRDQA
jgi:Domain of unknown function (DUF2017)